jgi:hypothetical protein
VGFVHPSLCYHWLMDVGECAYCGEQRELTRDHIPPRCLFGKPRPADLITVPSCVDCNQKASKHDEYFRIAVTTGIDREKFPRENTDSVRAINSLARPASLRFAKTLLQNYKPNPSRLTIDCGRIKTVLFRIARGLFYHHKGVGMPGAIVFEIAIIDGSQKISMEGRERIKRLDENLTTIGRGVFRYAFEPFEPPDPFGTAWLMRFYDHKTFFCLTVSG